MRGTLETPLVPGLNLAETGTQREDMDESEPPEWTRKISTAGAASAPHREKPGLLRLGVGYQDLPLPFPHDDIRGWCRGDQKPDIQKIQARQQAIREAIDRLYKVCHERIRER
jgi:hypothetical protein